MPRRASSPGVLPTLASVRLLRLNHAQPTFFAFGHDLCRETGLHFSGSCPGAVRGRGLALGAAKGHIESMSGPAIPERAPAATSADDTILPFAGETLALRWRVVRMGPAYASKLRIHRAP